MSIHRDYGCRRAGACCTSGWTIPVEAPTYDGLEQARHSGRLVVPVSPDDPPLLRFPLRSGEYAGLLGCDDSGRCAFYETTPAAPQADGDRSSSCAIHRQLGHAALPHACQQFPRVAVLRPSSIAVSLSHYCPTAASLLFRNDVPLQLEANPPAFPAERLYDGLDARQALPPLLRPDALFSWTAFDQWERFVVDAMADASVSLSGALGRIVTAAETVRQWTVARGAFDEWVAGCLAEATTRGDGGGAVAPSIAAATDAYDLAAGMVPSGVRVADIVRGLEDVWERDVAHSWPSFDFPVRRYLAARAWASWIGHEGGGIRSYVRWLFVVLGVLRVEIGRGVGLDRRTPDRALLTEAFRRADLLLVHLISPAALATALAAAENRDL